MKKIVIIDGTSDDESQVKQDLGGKYEVSSLSSFELNNMALSTVITIANTLDSCDAYSGGSSLRVAVIARSIAENLGWDERECQNVYFAALLHDIGMITVPESIVHKPGRLTELEYDAVKFHPRKSAEMLRDITVLDHLDEVALYHHERWDGSGYPNGLAGKDIPESARVVAIADAYNAMNSGRIYRSRLSDEKIISEFLRCRGSQFDPDMTDVFVFMLKDGYSIDDSIEQSRIASQRAAADGGREPIFTFGDASESEEEMDALTGLFSRSYLNTRVGKKIVEEHSGALMLIDIIGFEAVREKYGTIGCEDLVKRFSARVRSLFREEDVVCAIGDDKFAVYVSGESGKAVIEKKAQLISQMMDSNDDFEKYRDIAGIRIGIAMCQEDGVTFEELYGAASTALSEARHNKENTYRFTQEG